MRKQKHILISGGAGFIGSHIAETLLHQGYEVTILDRFSTIGPDHPFFEKNKQKLHYWQYDLQNSLFQKIGASSYDAIIHVSGKNGVSPSFTDPSSYFSSNVTATRTLLEFARIQKIGVFLYASTLAVYGDASKIPTTESYPCSPMSPYALSKYIGEQIALHYASVYGLRVVSFRMAGVYGPDGPLRGASASILSTIKKNVRDNQEVLLDGDGSQIRDFVDVRDVRRAYALALEKPVSGIFNIGGGRGIQLKQLAKIMGGKISYSGKPAQPPLRVWASITKAKDQLGWSPEYRLSKY